MKPQATIAPTTTMGIVGENPHSVNGGLIGSIKPQVLAETKASTINPIESAESSTPSQSNLP